MTDEERQRMMEFILAQQAQFWASIQKPEELQQSTAAKTNRHDHQLDRLERILKLEIKAGRRERKRLREQDEGLREQDMRLREQNELFAQRMEALRESQAHSDKRLEALIDIVREQRNGNT